jgi:hypothetical protein
MFREITTGDADTSSSTTSTSIRRRTTNSAFAPYFTASSSGGLEVVEPSFTASSRSRQIRGGSVGPGLYSYSSSYSSPSYSNYETSTTDYDGYSTTGGSLTTTAAADDDDDDTSSTRSFRTSARRRYQYGDSTTSTDYRRGITPLSSSEDSAYASSSTSWSSLAAGPSRYQRRYSLADSSPSHGYSSPSYGGGAGLSRYSSVSNSSTGGTEFRSKFLDKVRERKALAAMGLSTPATSDAPSASTVAALGASSSNADKGFKSRFLRSY